MTFPQCGEIYPQSKQVGNSQNSVGMARWVFYRCVLEGIKVLDEGLGRKLKNIFSELVVFLFKSFLHLIQQNKKQHDRARIHSTYW